ncbi:MAG: ATP-binding protein, partial [Candidatus Gracilibacteria bacterium]
ENAEPPRAGVCTYLWIDGAFADQWGTEAENSSEVRDVLLQLGSLASDRKDKNYTICNYAGGILIVDSAERGGADLVNIADGLNEVFDGRVNMFAAMGNVTHHDVGDGRPKFSIDTLPSIGDEGGDLNQMKKDMRGGVYLSGNIYNEEMGRLNGRHGGRNKTDAEKITGGQREMLKPHELFKLKSHIPDVEFHVGGPDKPIGIDDKIDTCNKWIKDPSVQLIEISGEAGSGKSRLMAELQKKYPDAVRLSMSASGKASSMHSLATIMGQFITHLKRREYSENISGNDVTEFERFSKMNPAEMKRAIQMNPQEVIDLFSRALNGLRDEKNELVIFLDDLHDTDRDSIGPLVKILREVAGKSGVKIIQAGRQDEWEEPLVWSDFKKDIEAQDGLRSMEVDGLDFSNKGIAHEYILHSLPPEIQSKGADVDGTWCDFLAKKAGRSPFAMTTCMELIMDEANDLLESTGNGPFVIVEGKIDLDPKFFDSIKHKLPEFNDLDSFYAEKVKKLPPSEAKAMRCIALLGGSVSEAQLAMLKKMFEDEGRVGIEMLQKRKYLDFVDGEYKIHHPLMTGIITSSIDSSEKVELSMKLYKQFEGDETLGDPDVLLGILHNVADKVGFDEDPEFWDEYAGRTFAKYAACNIDCARKAAYGTAMQVLDDMNEDSNTPMGRLIGDISAGKEIPREIVMLAVNSLIEVGKNAIVLGKVTEGNDALFLLEQMIKGSQFPKDKLEEVYMIMFELQYVSTLSKTGGAAELRRIYSKKLNNGERLNPMQKAVFELKIAYRDMNMEEFERIKDEYRYDIKASSQKGSPFFKEYIEVFHLINCRVPFEVIGMDAARTMDEDVLMHPGALTALQRSEMRGISENLVELRKMKEANPGMMSYWSEVMTLDQEAQVAAFMGEHDESARLFSEYWRQVRQMDSGEYTARGAKLRGDVLVIDALKNKPLDPEKIKRAIEAYSEQGIKYLSEIPKNRFYQFSLRVQRIRAISLLMEANLAKRERAGMTEMAQIDFDSEEYLKTAFSDFEYINKDPKWGSKEFIQDKKEGYPYYVAGCMWPLINAARKMRLRDVVPDGIEGWPWMDEEDVRKGLVFAQSKKVTNPELDDLEDNDRKTGNINLLLSQFIVPKKTTKKKAAPTPYSIVGATAGAIKDTDI